MLEIADGFAALAMNMITSMQVHAFAIADVHIHSFYLSQAVDIAKTACCVGSQPWHPTLRDRKKKGCKIGHKKFP